MKNIFLSLEAVKIMLNDSRDITKKHIASFV